MHTLHWHTQYYKTNIKFQQINSEWLQYPTLINRYQIGNPDQKKINKALELNDTIDQMNLTNTYRIFHTIAAE
jgi:hypothetical protein